MKIAIHGLRAVAALAGLALLLFAGSLRAQAGDVVVLVADNAWDGVANAPLGPTEVLVQDGNIAAIGSSVERPAGAREVRLPKGYFLMPGFIDSHVHLTIRPQYEGAVFNLSSAYKAILGVQALDTLLSYGFTTVRDLGDMDIHGYTTSDLSRAVAQGVIPGPDVIPAGHIISARGGHGDATALLGADSDATQNSLADGVDEIRKVVREEINHGAKWIKFGGTGGFSTPSDDPSQVPYSQEEMNVLVETAADLGVPVTPHAYGDEGISRAVKAGARSIEHGSLASAATLQEMERKGVYIVPTQMEVVRHARLVEDDSLWAAERKPPYVRAKYRKYADGILKSRKALADSKVKIVFGTDIGTFSYATNNAGEFKEMVTNGIAPLRALQAATSTAAEMLQLNDRGQLAVGKRADIVAMPGNPFDDITVTEKVDFVMKQGHVYKSPAN